MRGHIPHPFNTFHLVHHGQQLGKVSLLVVLAIGINILSQQGNLFVALFNSFFHLSNNFLRQTAAFPSPDIRNNAIGTEIIAPVHNRHPGRQRSFPVNGNIFRHLRLVNFRIYNMLYLGLLQLLNCGHNLMNFIGSQHKVNMRSPLYQPLPFFLRHTAGNTQNKVRVVPLQALYFTYFSVNLVLCCFPHTAGVYHNQVRLGHILSGSIANFGQLPLHPLGIAEIHLTAICQHLQVLFI